MSKLENDWRAIFGVAGVPETNEARELVLQHVEDRFRELMASHRPGQTNGKTREAARIKSALMAAKKELAG